MRDNPLAAFGLVGLIEAVSLDDLLQPGLNGPPARLRTGDGGRWSQFVGNVRGVPDAHTQRRLRVPLEPCANKQQRL